MLITRHHTGNYYYIACNCLQNIAKVMTVDTVEIHISFDFYCFLKIYKADYFLLVRLIKSTRCSDKKIKNVFRWRFFSPCWISTVLKSKISLSVGNNTAPEERLGIVYCDVSAGLFVVCLLYSLFFGGVFFYNQRQHTC